MSEHDPKHPPGGEIPRAKPARGSLFERASGAFGLDRLATAPPPITEPGEPRLSAGQRARAAAATPAAAEAEAPAAPLAPRAQAPFRTAPKTRLSGPTRAVSRAVLRAQGLIDPDGGASMLLEEFRIIKRQLIAAARADASGRSNRILVSSPHPDEGKTFCAINLALALAGERDAEVVLVDADFAKPSVPERLGFAGGEGLMDVLGDDRARIEDHVCATDIPGLFVLPAGSRTGRDAEHLASARTGAALDRLTDGAPDRFVIFDSPPALAASPAAELAKHVGQALLVVRADQTGRPALEDAVDLLAACGDIKLVLNDATFSPSGRRFGSYYGYGE